MSQASHPQRVLIVDDEPDLLGVLDELFTLFGFEVRASHDGAEALGQIEEHDFDVVLTDLRMPRMDGLEMVRRIRAVRRVRPIIMVTSGFSDHPAEAIYEAGANGFLSKPFGASGVRDAFVLASVPPERRWAQARAGGEHLTLRRTMSEAEATGQLTLGQGGMYWGLAGAVPRVGQVVEFVVERPVAPAWSGQGIVRWTRADGCGIEFLHLDPECRAEIIGRISESGPVAFLPRA